MLERAIKRRCACVVGVVMPFQIVIGAGQGGPGLCLVQGVHSVVLHLTRTDRGERVVVKEKLGGAADIPVVSGTQRDIQDAPVFVNGDGSAGDSGRILSGARGYGNVVREALGDDVIAVKAGRAPWRER